jgi:predicted ArsR family transcriptional regulator
MPNRSSVTTTDSEQPTEARLVALIRAAQAPLDTATIARRLALHPNGVRVQLQRLESRGVVERDTARGEVGRPRALWRLTPRAIAEADLPHTGWAMARSLARAIPATSARLREVEDAGTEMGRELTGYLGQATGGDARKALGNALEALGFEPRRTDDGRRARYRLMTCPYADTVRENPTVVCTLHRGIVRGVLESVAPAAELTAFEPKDPGPAGCIVEVRLSGGADPAL